MAAERPLIGTQGRRSALGHLLATCPSPRPARDSHSWARRQTDGRRATVGRAAAQAETGRRSTDRHAEGRGSRAAPGRILGAVARVAGTARGCCPFGLVKRAVACKVRPVEGGLQLCGGVALPSRAKSLAGPCSSTPCVTSRNADKGGPSVAPWADRNRGRFLAGSGMGPPCANAPPCVHQRTQLSDCPEPRRG